MSRQEREEAKDEARVLSSLRHRFIVSCLDAFIADNDAAGGSSARLAGAAAKQLYIVMEFCDAGNLYLAAHKQRRLLPERLVWRYFIQSLLGLEHIHRNKVRLLLRLPPSLTHSHSLTHSLALTRSHSLALVRSRSSTATSSP